MRPHSKISANLIICAHSMRMISNYLFTGSAFGSPVNRNVRRQYGRREGVK
jgi:hypothetical protein